MDIKEIFKVLPHRYPFVMIDKVLEMTDKKAVGLKNVTINEPFFQGHFPGHPVMPGVLMIEAMAQLGGVFSLVKREDLKGKIAYFLGIDNARFRKTVVPGDQLVIEVTLTKAKKAICQMHGVAKVKDEVAAEADIMFGFVGVKE